MKLSLPWQIAAQAEFIVNNLQQTNYQHTENIDVDLGIYDCDCNGFVGFVMERAAPDHYAMIPKETDQPRPRAFEYYDFISVLTPEFAGAGIGSIFCATPAAGISSPGDLQKSSQGMTPVTCFLPPRHLWLTLPVIFLSGSTILPPNHILKTRAGMEGLE